MAMSRQDLLEMFHKTAVEVVERDLPGVGEATTIASLNIDSLGMLEIIGSMERQLKVRLPDEQLAGIETVKDLVDLVQQRQGVAA